MAVTIRRAVPGDGDLVADLWQELYQTVPPVRYWRAVVPRGDRLVP